MINQDDTIKMRVINSTSPAIKLEKKKREREIYLSWGSCGEVDGYMTNARPANGSNPLRRVN